MKISNYISFKIPFFSLPTSAQSDISIKSRRRNLGNCLMVSTLHIAYYSFRGFVGSLIHSHASSPVPRFILWDKKNDSNNNLFSLRFPPVIFFCLFSLTFRSNLAFLCAREKISNLFICIIKKGRQKNYISLEERRDSGFQCLFPVSSLITKANDFVKYELMQFREGDRVICTLSVLLEMKF